MADIVITEEDRASAEAILAEFIKEKMGEVDLTRGTSLRDLLVTGMSLVAAYFRSEADNVKALQSIRTAEGLADSVDRDEAVDNLLSNLFISRKSGRESRGVISITFTQPTSITISPEDKFSKGGLAYKSDSTSVLTYTSDDMTAVYDANGDVSYYMVSFNAISEGTGVEYDAEPGLFSGTTLNNPFISQVENFYRFIGGRSTETTDELLERAPSALTVRDLVTDRAIKTVLLDTFASLDKVTVIGYGDAEMHRDRVTTLGTPLNFHLGGHIDIYVSSGISEAKTVTVEVGGAAIDPRLEVTVFRDDVLTGVSTFDVLGVQEGMILNIYNNSVEEPSLYIISEVFPTHLRVSGNSPFPEERSSVVYSIGSIPAGYVDVVPQTTTGLFTRTFSEPGRSVLPNEPIYLIRDISVDINDLPGGTFANSVIDVDNRVRFINRLNINKDTPLIAGTVPWSSDINDLEYSVLCTNPASAPSEQQIAYLDIPTLPDGVPIRVIYDTLSEYDTISSYVNASDSRNVCANTLVKGYHVAYAEGLFLYTTRSTATEVIDGAALQQSITDYINDFPSGELLNVSDIITHVQSTFTDVGSLIPVFLATPPVTWEDSFPYVVGDIVAPLRLSDAGKFYRVVYVDPVGGATASTEPEVWSADPDTLVVDGGIHYKKVRNYTFGYRLHAPDGRVITYVTNDEVTTTSDRLLNPTIPTDSLDTIDSPKSTSLGISDRTMRYLTDTTLIGVMQLDNV
jgi:hypothetical protein